MRTPTTTVYQSLTMTGVGNAISMTALTGKMTGVKRLELFAYKVWPTDGTAPTNNVSPIRYGFKDSAGVTRTESIAAGAKVTIDAPADNELPQSLVAYGAADDVLWIRAIAQ